MRSLIGFVATASMVLGLVFGSVACQKATMPEDMPGPPGCGMKDPRNTAPGTLSLAQKMTLKKQGDPNDVEKNDEGGLTWIYGRTSGSVFGQQETITKITFNAQGILTKTDTELVSKVGK